MSTDPNQIRSDIEQTRSQMGDTVEALGYKADVPTRAKDSVQGKVDSVKSRITGAAPDPQQAKGQARRAVGAAQSNPLGLAIGGIAVGLLAGMPLPGAQKEHQALRGRSDPGTGPTKDTPPGAPPHGQQNGPPAPQTAE